MTSKIKGFLVRHKRIMILAAASLVAVILVIMTTCYLLIERDKQFIYSHPTLELQHLGPVTGLVFGGGVSPDGKPLPLLEDRLRTAATLLGEGLVNKLIVSGDNRFANYNEPQAMKNFLVDELGIQENYIQLDNAGRSTYESCERAVRIFGLKQVVLISESTHLPRAIYLCRSFGLTAYGYASDGQSSSGLKAGQHFRETMARTKAVFNVYVVGEKTVLGEPIPL